MVGYVYAMPSSSYAQGVGSNTCILQVGGPEKEAGREPCSRRCNVWGILETLILPVAFCVSTLKALCIIDSNEPENNYCSEEKERFSLRQNFPTALTLDNIALNNVIYHQG
jgi:hypothetical protein